MLHDQEPEEFNNPIISHPGEIIGRSGRRRERAQPGVAVVLCSPRGALLTEWDHPLPWLERARATAAYRVNVGEHWLHFTCRLPCEGDAHHFQADVALTWRVHDPGEVVRRNLTNVSAVLRPWAERRMRRISREVSLADSEQAENMINQQVGDQAHELDCGITLTSFHAKVYLDETEWKHLRELTEVRREIALEKEREALAKVRHDHATEEAKREAELTEMKSQRARTVVQQGLMSVLAEHLVNHPADQAYVIAVLREEGLTKMRSTVEVLQAMLSARKLEGVDLDRVREHALRTFLDGLKVALAAPEIQRTAGELPAEKPPAQVVVEGASQRRDEDDDDDEEDDEEDERPYP